MGLFGLIISILIGALAGFIAGKLMETNDHGFIMNAIIGLIGSAIGGCIGHFFHISGGLLTNIILAVVGSCLLIFIVKKLAK